MYIYLHSFLINYSQRMAYIEPRRLVYQLCARLNTVAIIDTISLTITTICPSVCTVQFFETSLFRENHRFFFA